MSFPLLVGISVFVGLLTVSVSLRIWLARTGRILRINQNIAIIAITAGSALMATGSVIGLIWGRDKGVAGFNGVAAVMAAAAAFELHRRKRQRDRQTGEHHE